MTPISSLVTDQAALTLYIPNLVFATDGEDELFAKISPHIDATRDFIEHRITGPEIPEDLKGKVSAIIALRAFALAAPQLDLVITPNGFGVVSTTDTAPASKERVERLITQLHDSADIFIDQVIRSLIKDEQWRSTPQADYFCQTFFHQVRVTNQWRRRGEDSLDCLLRIAQLAAFFENAAADFCIGQTCLQLMNADFHGVDSEVNSEDQVIIHRAAQMFFAKLCAWISYAQAKDFVPDPSEQYLYQSLRLVTATLMRSDVLASIIRQESAINNPHQDIITRPGALFF